MWTLAFPMQLVDYANAWLKSMNYELKCLSTTCTHNALYPLASECNRSILFLKTKDDLRDVQDSCLDFEKKITFCVLLLQAWISSRNVDVQSADESVCCNLQSPTSKKQGSQKYTSSLS